MQPNNNKKSFLRSFHDGFNNISSKDVVYAALLGLISGLIFAVFFLVIVAKDLSEDQNRVAQKVLKHSAELELQFEETFKKLNAAHYISCSSQNMELMQDLLFQAEYIKNIGFIQNGMVVCSAARGLKDHPIGVGPLNAHEKPNGTLVVPKRMLEIFGHTYSLDIFRRGNYSILYDFNNTEKLVPAEYNWQLTHEYDGKSYYLAGLMELPKQTYSLNFGAIAPLLVAREKICDDATLQCVTIEPSTNVFQSKHIGYVLLLSLAVLLIIIISTFCFLKLFNWRKSMGYRAKKAFKENNFYCLYQPVVDLKTRNIIGVEVLARMWENGKEISPVDFIPSIAANGLSWPFTNFIVSKALKELEQIKSIDKNFKVAFNVFPTDVENGVIRGFSEILGVSSFQGQMMIEITESEFLEGVQAQTHLNELSAKGYSLAIDDFGTGYSNMQQLDKIKCDILKIDRNFVSAISTNKNFSPLISHMVDIARSANMKVVAEGVEDENQLQALASLGIEYGQGWLFGQPSTIKEIIKLLNQNTYKS